MSNQTNDQALTHAEVVKLSAQIRDLVTSVSELNEALLSIVAQSQARTDALQRETAALQSALRKPLQKAAQHE